MPIPRRGRRVLLAATVGLATVTLGGCGGFTSGNLVAPPPTDAGHDAGHDAGPADAGTDANADDAGTDDADAPDATTDDAGP